MIIRIKNTRIEITDETAELLVKNRDTINQMALFWDRHITYMQNNKKNMHRPRVVDLVSEAMNHLYVGNYKDMPNKCKRYYTDLREKENVSMSKLRNKYIKYGNEIARYCIEAYISKQYDRESMRKQKGKQNIKYTKNKYKLTRGTFYNAKKKLGW